MTPTYPLLPPQVQSQSSYILEENLNPDQFSIHPVCIIHCFPFRRQTKVVKTKAELNDQLSDRESCRQESSELTRANRKLFHHITTIINKFEKAENRQNYPNI